MLFQELSKNSQEIHSRSLCTRCFECHSYMHIFRSQSLSLTFSNTAAIQIRYFPKNTYPAIAPPPRSCHHELSPLLPRGPPRAVTFLSMWILPFWLIKSFFGLYLLEHMHSLLCHMYHEYSDLLIEDKIVVREILSLIVTTIYIYHQTMYFWKMVNNSKIWRFSGQVE